MSNMVASSVIIIGAGPLLLRILLVVGLLLGSSTDITVSQVVIAEVCLSITEANKFGITSSSRSWEGIRWSLMRCLPF
jgi:hypothetical protein